MLLFSINPRFVHMILRGEKYVELRRRAPRCSTDFWLALYATTPVRAVIGVVRAREVVVATPDELWAQVEDGCGLGGDEYRRYYEGTSRAVGIWLEAPISFPNPVTLDSLRTHGRASSRHGASPISRTNRGRTSGILRGNSESAGRRASSR